MTAIPEGPSFRPLVEVLDQPSDCTDHCPCNVGPSDLSEDGMHWAVAGDAA